MTEHVFEGGRINRGSVVRVGNTVRRPRSSGAEVVEALLLHLEDVGFEFAPRFLGIDDQNRQILEHIEGDVAANPAWQLDDERNAEELGRLAALLRQLHGATEAFEPPPGFGPQRPLPIPGSIWTHGDPGYANVVSALGRPVGLIDWEFAAPAEPMCDPGALLAMEIRGPRPDVPDLTRRAAAARNALATIAMGYGADDEQRRALPGDAAAVLDDAVVFWISRGRPAEELAATSWRASWFRNNAEWLLT